MTVLEPDLPAGRDSLGWRRVAGPRERVEPVTHAPGPVLVVSDTDEQPVSLQDLGMCSRSGEIAMSRRYPFAAPSAGTAVPSSTSRSFRSRPKSSGSAHPKNQRASRSGSGCIFRRCGSGLTRNPGAIGRSNETRVPPV